MDECAKMREELIELLFGELDDERELALNRHLLHCPACREEERRLLALREDLTSDVAVVDPGLRTRVRNALPGRKKRGILETLRRPVPAYAALAAAVLVALLAWELPLGERDRGGVRPARVAARTPAAFVPAGAYTTSWENGAAGRESEEWPTHPESLATDSL